LVRQLAQRPTHASELVQGDDDFLGYCDASAARAGGVWFAPGRDTPIVNQVVSDDNPTGTITNSDLELAAVLLHVAVLCSQVDTTHKRVGILSNNSATVYWAKRMASRAQTSLSADLLHGLAFMARSAHLGPLTLAHVEGKTKNAMADFASRSFVSHPADVDFFCHFSQTFPTQTPTAGASS
jgi:hypothetical protein